MTGKMVKDQRTKKLTFEWTYLSNDGRLILVKVMRNFIEFKGREYSCSLKEIIAPAIYNISGELLKELINNNIICFPMTYKGRGKLFVTLLQMEAL